METSDFAGLAGVLEGCPDGRPPLVVLHGLTFSHTMWQPAVAELRKTDPGRQVLALDLPGHGDSPVWPSYGIESVAAAVHRAAAQAGLREPVVVGHSIAAVIATVYAARYPVSGVVNVDQPLRVESFASLVKSLAGEIHGGGFAGVWERFEASMNIGLLPVQAQQLLAATRRVRQDLVAGYWREVLDRPVAELAGRTEAALAALRAARACYLFIGGHEVDPGYRSWLHQELPQAGVAIWPGSGHFPHLAHPGRFAQCLAATSRWDAAA